MSDIYRELVIDHYKHPRNKGAMPSADCHGHEDNIVCGDTVDMYLRFGADEKVKEATWTGEGCALSQASASLLSGMLKGKTKAELEAISDDSILAVIGKHLHPSRQKCATLSVVALKKALEKKS